MPLIRRWLFCLPLLLLASNAARADELREVIVVSRHGVRTPLALNGELNQYSAQPWPDWPAAPGLLTPHGRALIAEMGRYYRARYVGAGILTGVPAVDAGRVFVATDNDDRTIQSGRLMAQSLLGGKDPVVHSRPAGTPDPLWVLDQSVITPADRQRGVAAILGRVGGDPATMRSAYGAAYRSFAYVLAGPAAAGLGRPQIDVSGGATTITPGAGKELVTMGPFFRAAESLIGNFTLEYTDGRPAAEVGWGRLTEERLAELTELQALYFDLSKRTFPIAQMEGSDLLSHIVATFRQAAGGVAIEGAFGTPAQRVVILNGHDDNVENMGGLLRLSWAVPGVARNVSLPGGAIVFELWRETKTGADRVKAYYISETVAQMRAGAPLTSGQTPFIAPLYIPECSQTDLSAPWPDFERVAARVIDPRFVVPLGS